MGAPDVTGAAGSCAVADGGVLHRCDDRRMLGHGQIVVTAPDLHIFIYAAIALDRKPWGIVQHVD